MQQLDMPNMPNLGEEEAMLSTSNARKGGSSKWLQCGFVLWMFAMTASLAYVASSTARLKADAALAATSQSSYFEVAKGGAGKGNGATGGDMGSMGGKSGADTGSMRGKSEGTKSKGARKCPAVFTTGQAGTYTYTPDASADYIRVRISGAGGAGSDDTQLSPAQSGGQSSFSSFVVLGGGQGGTYNSISQGGWGGAGGVLIASTLSGLGYAISGDAAGNGDPDGGDDGGRGGSSGFGGGGGAPFREDAQVTPDYYLCTAGSLGGGGGGGPKSGGGGAGAYSEFILYRPSGGWPTYSYTLGAGGVAAAAVLTGTENYKLPGCNGSNGFLLIEEFCD
eukprot:g7132.t1